MDTTYSDASKEPLGVVHGELDLIRFSQNGDRDAFGCLYETHRDQIYRYIYFRMFDHEVAEDMTSLVFLKVWEHLGSFQGGKIPFAKWLYRIAHNTVIDYYRTRKTVIPLEDVDVLKLSHSDNVDEKLDLHTCSQDLAELLKELTSTQREVLILRFILGFTTLEIANKLKKGRGAIRALQMRGLRRLSQHLAIRNGLIDER